MPSKQCLVYVLMSLLRLPCVCAAEKLRNENADLKQQATLRAPPTKSNGKDSSAKVKEMETLVARAAAENETLVMELKQVTPHNSFVQLVVSTNYPHTV